MKIICRNCVYLTITGGCQESYLVCVKRSRKTGKIRVSEIKDPDNHFCAQFKAGGNNINE